MGLGLGGPNSQNFASLLGRGGWVPLKQTDAIAEGRFQAAASAQMASPAFASDGKFNHVARNLRDEAVQFPSIRLSGRSAKPLSIGNMCHLRGQLAIKEAGC